MKIDIIYFIFIYLSKTSKNHQKFDTYQYFQVACQNNNIYNSKILIITTFVNYPLSIFYTSQVGHLKQFLQFSNNHSPIPVIPLVFRVFQQ